MGNQSTKTIRDRIAFFGDIRSTDDLQKMIEATKPIVVDLASLEKHQEPQKKAA